jgi:tRNA threonylcarbamoyladenosine modification (KEOPS) complex  Pcc1 subunit
MKSEIVIDTQNDKLSKILAPSLESRGKVELGLEDSEGEITITVETDGLGPLRGTTDNVFRLANISKKIIET